MWEHGSDHSILQVQITSVRLSTPGWFPRLLGTYLGLLRLPHPINERLFWDSGHLESRADLNLLCSIKKSQDGFISIPQICSLGLDLLGGTLVAEISGNITVQAAQAPDIRCLRFRRSNLFSAHLTNRHTGTGLPHWAVSSHC